MDDQFKIKRVLITGKTYPNPARKGVEVSCIGGITEEGRWIRLFPIPFRLLDDSKKFKKYDEIEVRAKKARADNRPESYQIDYDSIKVVSSMKSGLEKWNYVKERLLPLTSNSLCQLQEDRRTTGVTIGIFQPAGVVKLSIEPAESIWSAEQLRKLRNFGMFDVIPDKPLEKIPFKFVYSFKCAETSCHGHNLSCVDWELIQTYRNFRRRYQGQWEPYFREKAEQSLFSDREVYFSVGTVHRFPGIWIIGSIFYPPRTWDASLLCSSIRIFVCGLGGYVISLEKLL